MPTPRQIAHAAAGAFIGKLWGRRLQHDEHGDALTETILDASKEIEAEKDARAARAIVKGTMADSTFEVFWDLYAKKVDREKCRLKWRRLSGKTRQRILEHVPGYVGATSDDKYRKNPLTYLNGCCWLDEGLPANGAAAALLTHAEAVKEMDKHGGNKRLQDFFLVLSDPDTGKAMFQRKS